MSFARASLMLGFVVLAGCGGTFTRTGDDPGTGGSAGAGASAGSAGSVGRGGSGTGAVGGTSSGGAGAIGGTNSAGSTSSGGYATDGGYGNQGGAGAAAGSSFGGDGCGPKTSPLGPYPVKFVFSSNTPMYLRFDCSLNYNLYACGSSALTRSNACTADCSDTSSGCIACGACAYGAKPVGPGASLEDSWDGRIYSFGTLPSGCACTTGANAAPGMYTIGLSEFFSEADALANTNGYPRQVQFQLPAPNGVVQVDLGFIGI